VNFHDLVSELIVDTKGVASSSFFEVARQSSLGAFAPELALCATILVLLLLRLFQGGQRVSSFYVVLVGTAAALYLAAPWHLTTGQLPPRMEIFTGMLVVDSFAIYIRSLLLLFVLLFAVFARLTGIPDREDAADIFSLVLGATLGMCLMCTANHLLMVFMAVEMASVPSYVLAGLLKGRRLGSEAALKYAVYGGGAAGVMLYGISLLAGLLNTAHLPTMATQLAEKLPDLSQRPAELMVLALGGLMVGVGLAFKLSAFPFHFWAPDVFEGAPAEVGAFLSVASKAAALALLVRVALGLGMPVTVNGPMAVTHVSPAVAAVTFPVSTLLTDEAPTKSAESAPAAPPPKDPVAALQPVRDFAARVIALLAILTCTFGNLAAYGQTNIKRLLGYSTIAHAGYMMMPVAALVAMAGKSPEIAERAAAGLGIYIAVYLFMNLGAFACVAFLRNALGSEEIAAYSGLIRRSPLTAVCFSLILFSLVGMPPLSGFVGKFAIFASLAEAWQAAGESGTFLLWTLLFGGLNTAICLFYYLRVIKVMTIDDEPAERSPVAFGDVSLQGAYLWLITAPTAVLMVSWSWLGNIALAAARQLLS
jgi:NADH-quinone oxidoreductase subunit N